tara:strand:- start:1276 stop:1662 length:387 start_codon:yes stop_codon:yes gene_type:complete
VRKSNNYIVITSVLLFFTTSKLIAQSGIVKIEQDSIITQFMDTKIKIDTENYASKFFTIQLFYGDNERAQELYDNFKENYPDWEADLSFETPNYKVQVGRFKEYYFGLNKLNQIKRAYPDAFLLETKY